MDSKSPYAANKRYVSLYALSKSEWQKGVAALRDFDGVMDYFLLSWTKRMKASGYLDFTTARRQDCIAACHALLDPIVLHEKENVFPGFEQLRTNSDNWAEKLLETGRRHLKRGITSAMYLGCFKTFIFAMEDSLPLLTENNSALTEENIESAKTVIKIYAHSFETVWAEFCDQMHFHQQDREMNETFRLLTLEKCRFENIFNTTSDGVLVMDANCRVMTANRSLKQYIGENLDGKFIWQVLGLEGESPEDFFRYYPIGQTVEITPFQEKLVFRLSIVSLGGVSMASQTEYLVLLTNITPHVLQREMLEAAIARHTEDLCMKKQQVEEMNITLHNVLSNIHAEKEKQHEILMEKISSFLRPALAQLAAEPAASIRKNSAELIFGQVENILDNKESAQDKSLGNKKMRHLTLTELKVCNLIRVGKTTKEIAQALKISPETVQTHRKNIRKKLGVSGHKTQLSMHLIDNSESASQE